VDELLRLLAAGLIGGVLGPVIFDEYQTWRRERSWKKPRKELLTKMLSGDLVYRTLDTLSRTTGTAPEDCRSLLIEIDARGGTMPDGREAWALISRAPLQQEFDAELVQRNLAVVEEEEEEEE
jgi:hypothetical protein